MCARFTVLSDTPIAAAIAGWAIPLSRNNTIWMRWRCAAGIFQRNAVFSIGFAAFDHLFSPNPMAQANHTSGEENSPRLSAKNPDSSRYGGGISVGWRVTVASDPPPGTVGITRSTIGTIWQIFENSEYGLDRLCVQRRLACSAGDRPAGARVRSPVVWIAGWRETKTLKPIDKVSPGEITSHRAVTTVNAQVASKMSESEGRACN